MGVLTNIFCITVIVSGLVYNIHADNCNGKTLYSVTVSDIYNGFDPRVEGPSKDSVNGRDMMKGSGGYIQITGQDHIELVFNSKKSLNIKVVSLSSRTVSQVKVNFIDGNDEVIEEILTEQSPCGKLTTGLRYVSGVQKVIIKPIVSENDNNVDIGDVSFLICTEFCEAVSELDFPDFGSLFNVKSNGKVNPELIFKGSGATIVGCGSPLLFQSTSGRSTIEVTLNTSSTVSAISMETYQVKSISVKMYNAENSRVYRDTSSVDDVIITSRSEQKPFVQIEDVKSFIIELRHQDTSIDAGLQNLVISVCNSGL